MSLREEIESIKSIPKYDDEEVYDSLIKNMYEYHIKNPIVAYFKEHPESNVFQGSFQLEYCPFICVDREEAQKYRRDSDIYTVNEGEYSSYYIYLKGDCVLLERKPLSPKAKISLTPLGEKVYNDLLRLSALDGVELSKPKPWCNYDRNTLEGGTKTKAQYPQLDEDFILLTTADVSAGATVDFSYSFK